MSKCAVCGRPLELGEILVCDDKAACSARFDPGRPAAGMLAVLGVSPVSEPPSVTPAQIDRWTRHLWHTSQHDRMPIGLTGRLQDLVREVHGARRGLRGAGDARTGEGAVSRWRHSLCDPCFAEVRPDVNPVRLREPDEEVCCRCAEFTVSGIYYRADPDGEEVTCRGLHAETSP